MSNQDEDLLLSNDEDQPPPAWWSPSSLLTPEVTSITAFTIAVISIGTFGIGSSMLVEQSVLGAPAGPSGLRALDLMTAAASPGRPGHGKPAGAAVQPAGDAPSTAPTPSGTGPLGPSPGRRSTA